MSPKTPAPQRLKSPDADVLWVGPLESFRRRDVARVGGKCANLGELLHLGVEVPPGFAVTADAFQRFIAASGLADLIAKSLAPAKGAKDPQAFEDASKTIRGAIESAPVPADIAAAIQAAYEGLCEAEASPNLAVAVRSSATTEDGAEASFAGQQDTYLNVRGAEAVVAHVLRCWASLYTPRAIFYREDKGFPHDEVAIAVAVQKMVASESSGVVFTLDPVTGDRNRIVVESTWGLGEALVGGLVRPDRFTVDKKTLAITQSDIVHKTMQVLPEPAAGPGSPLTREHSVDPERADAPSLTPEEVSKLARIAVQVETHFGAPQDIEFAVEWISSSRRIRIVQARPETVHSRKPLPSAPGASPVAANAKTAAKGQAASPGTCTGVARVVLTPAQAAQELKPGDILVTRMTNPDWVPFMKVAGAIVTDDGGVTCHAAIVSREMGVPCIVGSRDGTKVLRNGQTYTVDARSGVVYEGVVESVTKRPGTQEPNGTVARARVAPPVTSTRVYVNLSIPDLAEKTARETCADGVGLLRAEHMLLSIGKHPRLFIDNGQEQEFVDAFAEGIRKVAAPFAPRLVVYRFLDLKPDEFLNLPGGQKYEGDAGHVGPNPLIGYRGCFRYTKEPDIFRLECRAIRKVRDEYNLRNVAVMLPFVRTLREFQYAKRIMEEEGLRRSRDFKLWMMCEVPSTVLTIDRFIEEGVDGISFGTNDLTMLVLGIDRDDASIQEIYDERNPAVLRAMQMVIRACSAAGVTTSVCGQAPSNHPEVVEFLVREGATSMSVNPDKVVETKELVAGIERKLLLEGVRNSMRGGRNDEAPRPFPEPQRQAPPVATGWWKGA